MSAVIVPWGTDNGPRERVWTRVRKLWEQTDCDLIVAADPLFGKVREAEYLVPDGPMWTNVHRFSVARAVNNAVRVAPPEYDKFVTFGADFLPCPTTVRWAASELDRQPWTLLFDRGVDLDQARTDEFVDTGAVRGLRDFPHQIFTSPCVGPIAFSRATFEKVGGFDERYEGWGYEDVDLWYRLQRDTPRTAAQNYPGTPLVQFWHPTEHHDLSQANPNVRLFAETWG
ncbi:galactosyltransferase-related protein [Amycolatopsis sp. VC5-11]|uniref:galactosyltransferase-related protein n=1 Tax=Amycolatopsis sp. VC5-11 TaxID=3120156 RepID=UPI0030093BAB